MFIRSAALRIRSIVLQLVLLICQPAWCLATTVTIPSTSSNIPRDQYQIGLLKLALDKAGFQYTIEHKKHVLSQARITAALKDSSSGIDIYWMGTSPELEDTLRAVRFPIYQGMLGYRVFIIHKSQQFEFDKVRTLQDLQQHIGIQGVGWSDTQILEASGLKQKTSRYNQILPMVNSGMRPFYFSRGIHEAYGEIEAVKDTLTDLAVEKNILLTYPFAMLFFTNKKNEALASALEKGLHLAHADGSYHTYFNNDPSNKRALEKARIHERTWIRIKNPYETPAIKNMNKRYWHQLPR
jgi:hypothetical protein